MAELELGPVMARYSRALDAKPSKGPITDSGIAAITDSVSDIPQLLAEIERLADWKASALTVMDGLQELGQALGLPLGERITGPLACAAAQALNGRAEAAEEAIARMWGLVSDWQANGNSCELGDPTDQVWQRCAQQLLDALNPPLPDWERELLDPSGPARHTIRVHGVTFACSCGFRDQAGALSIYNHACHHGGAYATDASGTEWVDRSCRVEGESIIGPGDAEVDRG